MLESFRGKSLKKTVGGLEGLLAGKGPQDFGSMLSGRGVTTDLLRAALLVKRTSRQIDEIIHTLGILLCLPGILQGGETVESLSLAAGNTGKGFDLETNYRIAEFTFIEWKGGSETIRQNKVFKDFYFLAEVETKKRRELWVVGTEEPLKFFNGRRGVDRILKGNAKLGESFRSRYGDKFKVVCDYYLAMKDRVEINDLTALLPASPKGDN